MFAEQKYRAPEEDTLSVVSGLLGSYPNALWRVAASWISVEWRIDDGSSVSNGPTGQRGLFELEPSPCCRTKMIDKLINCKRELP
jgi:hypothetical protein